MKKKNRLLQKGLASIIGLVFISVAVLFILMQSLSLSGSKSLESQEYYDHVAALALAESGMNMAIAQVTNNYGSNGNLGTSCNVASATPQPFGNGSFTILSSTLANSYCKVRVKGTINASNRTIETWVGLTDVIGTSGFGTTPSLSLKNPYPVGALSIFDLGWRVSTSAGQTVPISGNSKCDDCTTNQLWYRYLPGGNDLAGAGNSTTVAASSNTSYQHTLSDSRTYAMAGLILGGTDSGPVPSVTGSLMYTKNSSSSISGNYSWDKQVAVQKNGCADWNTSGLVLGIAGQGIGLISGSTYDYSGIFQAAMLTLEAVNSTNAGTIYPNVTFSPYVHYPNTDGTSPTSWGDIFVDLFYYNGPNITFSNLSGNNQKNTNTISLDNPINGLSAYTYVTSSTGAIANGTYIQSISPNKKQLTLSQNLTKDFNSGSVCAGTCGLLAGLSNMTLVMQGSSVALNNDWVAGVVCVKDVFYPNRVKVVTTSSPRVQKWHEVLSGE